MTEEELRALPLDQLRRLAMQQIEAETRPPEPLEVTFVREQWARFQELCPDFSGSVADAEALVRHLPEDIGLFPTGEELVSAHIDCWYRGEYKPAEQPLDGDPHTMPLHELKRAMQGLPQRPEGDEAYMQELHEMPIHELKNVMNGQPRRSEQDELFTMPLDELREKVREAERTEVDNTSTGEQGSR